MAPSRYDWKIVDWDVKPQHNQPTNTHCQIFASYRCKITINIELVLTLLSMKTIATKANNVDFEARLT